MRQTLEQEDERFSGWVWYSTGGATAGVWSSTTAMNNQRFFDFIEATPEPAGLATFQHAAIQVGHYKMSVQASEYHYCSPRLSCLPFRSYALYEVAIWDTADKDKGWISSEMYERIGLRPSEDDVRGWVDPDTIQAAFEKLNELGRLEVEKGE